MSTAAGDRSPVHQRALVGASLGAGGLLLFVHVREISRRALVNDDYQLLYTAWLRSEGKVPGRDFFMTSYHLLVDVLALPMRVLPHGFGALYAGRALLLLVLVGIGWLLQRLTARLFGRTAGLVAPVLALASASMLPRALDLRPDALSTLIWLWILDIVARRRLLDERTLAAVGALVGLAFVNRFKAVIIAPLPVALLCVDLAAEHRYGPTLRRIARPLAISAGAALLIVGAYFAALALSGQLGNYFEVNFALARELGDMAAPWERADTLAGSWQRDRAFWIAVGAGAALAIARARDRPTRENSVIAALAALALLSVLSNPAYYCYNLLTLVPLAAPFAALPLGLVIDRVASRFGAVAAVAVGVAAIGAPLALQRRELSKLASSNTLRGQLALERFLLEHTAADAPVFAMEGIGLFRPSVYHWRLPAVLLARYRTGEFRYEAELDAAHPELVIASYRVPGWLLPGDRAYLEKHYVALAPFVFVPGFVAREAGDLPFEVGRTGHFEVVVPADCRCSIDGDPVQPGQHVELAAGAHRMRTSVPGCSIRRAYPEAARASIDNPRRVPYLLAPSLELADEP